MSGVLTLEKVLRLFLPTDEKIIVATTRPETMLGDTGIAIHPDDARYTVCLLSPAVPGPN